MSSGGECSHARRGEALAVHGAPDCDCLGGCGRDFRYSLGTVRGAPRPAWGELDEARQHYAVCSGGCGAAFRVDGAGAERKCAGGDQDRRDGGDGSAGGGKLYVDPADARSPDGHVLGLNAEYLTLDGKPWLPVMGEMHYSRVPEAEWEEEILKMKSAGVEIVAAYIIWIHHEEVEGEWEWSGTERPAEVCGALRQAWDVCGAENRAVVHAEVRNGGFPDWLLAKTEAAALERSGISEACGCVLPADRRATEGPDVDRGRTGGGGAAWRTNIAGGVAGRRRRHILKLKEMAREMLGFACRSIRSRAGMGLRFRRGRYCRCMAGIRMRRGMRRLRSCRRARCMRFVWEPGDWGHGRADLGRATGNAGPTSRRIPRL